MASKTPRIVIVGAGTAGITIAAMLIKHLESVHILLIDPAEKHYYQPIWTLVGGGVFSKETSERDMTTVIPDGCQWVKDCVTAFDPANNALTTDCSGTFSYDYLIVAAGIQLQWSTIKGLTEAMNQPNTNVVSNYSYDCVDKTFPAIQRFQPGGQALFTHPNTPVKCGGAPMKIMYLMADYLQQHGHLTGSKIHFHKAGGVLFPVEKYKLALEDIVEQYGISTHWFSNLIEINAVDNIATFQDGKSGATFEQNYDFLHVTPPMSAPSFIRNSTLSNAEGWMNVNIHTLQHREYENIFSAGDCAGLPTAKTAAAIRKQAPTLVQNLIAHLKGDPLCATYNGYSSCPLVTGYNKLILAEFDYDKQPVESFPFDQSKELFSMYQYKAYGLPQLYWNGMLRGYC